MHPLPVLLEMCIHVLAYKFFQKSLRNIFRWGHKPQTFAKLFSCSPVHSGLWCPRPALGRKSTLIAGCHLCHPCLEVQLALCLCCMVTLGSGLRGHVWQPGGTLPEPLSPAGEVYSWSWNLNINLNWFHVKGWTYCHELYCSLSSNNFISKAISDLLSGILPSLVGTKIIAVIGDFSVNLRKKFLQFNLAIGFQLNLDKF